MRVCVLQLAEPWLEQPDGDSSLVEGNNVRSLASRPLHALASFQCVFVSTYGVELCPPSAMLSPTPFFACWIASRHNGYKVHVNPHTHTHVPIRTLIHRHLSTNKNSDYPFQPWLYHDPCLPTVPPPPIRRFCGWWLRALIPYSASAPLVCNQCPDTWGSVWLTTPC